MSKINRREFTLMATAVTVIGSSLQPFTALADDRVDAEAGNDLAFLTMTEGVKKLRAKEITSVELVSACLARIKVLNPKVNAYITVMRESVLKQAGDLDKEAKAGKFRGPLHGIPIALKDNIDTAGTRTTGGSAVYDDRLPDEDAEVVRRLLLAGAILLGKTNMQEFAMGGSSVSTYFYSVRNPWELARISAGSSGGSAAAVISDLTLGALGTDTGGSVRSRRLTAGSSVSSRRMALSLSAALSRAPIRWITVAP